MTSTCIVWGSSAAKLDGTLINWNLTETGRMSDEEPDVYVRVIYDFEYFGSDSKKVIMKEGEEFLLIKKTNNDWWQVIRDGEKRPFYAPASYMEEISVDPVHVKNNNVQNSCNSNERTSRSQSTGSLSDSGNSNEIKRFTQTQSKSFEKLDKIYESKPQQGLLFNNPLYNVNEDEAVSYTPYDEPEVDYSDVEIDCGEESGKESDGKAKEMIPASPSVLQDKLTHVECNMSAVVVTSKEDCRYQTRESVSPIYANFPLNSPPCPPSPASRDFPIKILHNHWAEFEDSNGRKYYYNHISHEKSWKPPRRRSEKYSFSSSTSIDNVSSSTSIDNVSWLDSNQTDQSDSLSQSLPGSPLFPLPLGWTQGYDDVNKEVCFINDITKERWFASTDEQGRVYYYQENALESFWQLPEVIITEADSNRAVTSTPNSNPPSMAASPSLSPDASPRQRRSSQLRPSSLADRRMKTRSMVLPDCKSSTLPRNLSVHQWPALHSGHMTILRQGLINKTKIIEGGKRLRKNWSSSFVVLSDLFLLFYKDMKSAHVKPGLPSSKPEICIDLAGALIEWKPDRSSRKNTFQISTVLGLQLLLQNDNAQATKEWFDAIKHAISKLPSGFTLNTTKLSNSNEPDLPSPDDSKKTFKLTRKYRSAGSNEDLETMPAERKVRIRDKLLNFFLRRPSMESLREKGIIKEERIFGCNLHNLCYREKTTVPRFIQKCSAIIEEKDMKADGLYRASGNLSQVQKIRFQVNQENTKCLEIEEDVHVLTGALKMFFRELKEPLIPFNIFETFLTAIMIQDHTNRLKVFTDLINSLPRQNYDTLKFLCQHLLRVTEYSDQNRMHIQNLAIVFGPTLMWPETESTNLALDMMTQNQIVEFILVEFSSIFR